MINITLSEAEAVDILTAIGGRLPGKRRLGEGFTGNQRLALRTRLEAALSRHALIACYQSGQMSEEQWQAHVKEDAGLADGS